MNILDLMGVSAGYVRAYQRREAMRFYIEPDPAKRPDLSHDLARAAAADAKRRRKARKLVQLAVNGAIEEVLPEGLWRGPTGELLYECISCGETDEWPAGVDDFDVNNEANMCGGSPRCCP